MHTMKVLDLFRRRSFSHVVNNQLSTNRDEEYIKELKSVVFEPIFILGVHRSGTSILYKMLAATGAFNSVTAYHLINYNELLFNHYEKKENESKQKLTESFLKNGLKDRGIDRLRVTADFAEEYGFLLGTKTVSMSITKKNADLFTEMCKKIQNISGNQKPLLLKNPYDFNNFLFIKQIFPSARFVFIHRHPVKTISSMLNAIRTILKEKNPYTARLSKIYDRCYSNPLLLQALRFIFFTIPECSVVLITRITASATGYYLKNVEALPKKDYISITYEELCEHPSETLKSIMDKLGVPLVSNFDAASLMRPRNVHVEPSVRQLQTYIYDQMKAYFEQFDYSKE